MRLKSSMPLDGGFLGAEGIQRLSKRMAEGMSGHHQGIEEINAENKRVLEGIPEWCALAAAPWAAEEGTEGDPQEEGAARRGGIIERRRQQGRAASRSTQAICRKQCCSTDPHLIDSMMGTPKSRVYYNCSVLIENLESIQIACVLVRPYCCQSIIRI